MPRNKEAQLAPVCLFFFFVFFLFFVFLLLFFVFFNNSTDEGCVHMFQGRTINLKCIYIWLQCMPMKMITAGPNLN